MKPCLKLSVCLSIINLEGKEKEGISNNAVSHNSFLNSLRQQAHKNTENPEQSFCRQARLLVKFYRQGVVGKKKIKNVQHL